MMRKQRNIQTCFEDKHKLTKNFLWLKGAISFVRSLEMLPEVVVGLALLIAAVVAITLFELFSDAAESMNKDLKTF